MRNNEKKQRYLPKGAGACPKGAGAGAPNSPLGAGAGAPNKLPPGAGAGEPVKTMKQKIRKQAQSINVLANQ